MSLSRVSRETVSPDEAARAAKTGAAVLIDVRTEAEWAEGHPAGAANVPFEIWIRKRRQPNADFLPVVDAVFGKSARLLVCSHSDEHAARAADLLRAAGYSSVAEIAGGYEAWVARGLPTETISEGKTYPDLRWQAGLG